MGSSERAEGRRFDRDRGVTTHALFFLSELDRGPRGEAYSHATHYEAVPVRDFRALMGGVPEAAIRASTFVDVGSGMGRAVLLATEYPFRRIVGVELSPGLHEIARENLARVHSLKAKCRDVRLVRADARRYRYPKGNLVVFLFNPFDGAALRLTLERILASRAGNDETIVVYHTPVHLDELAAAGAETIASFAHGSILKLPAPAGT